METKLSWWIPTTMKLVSRGSWPHTAVVCCTAPFRFLSLTPMAGCFCRNAHPLSTTRADCGAIPVAAIRDPASIRPAQLAGGLGREDLALGVDDAAALDEAGGFARRWVLTANYYKFLVSPIALRSTTSSLRTNTTMSSLASTTVIQCRIQRRSRVGHGWSSIACTRT